MKNNSSSVWFNIRSVWKCAATLLLGFVLCTHGSAQVANRVANQLASNTRNEIAELLREKATRTPTQQKINTQLLYAAKERRFGFINRRVPTLRASLKTQLSDSGRRVKVDIDATVTDDLIAAIKAAGGEILENFPDYHAIRAILPLDQVEPLAGRSEIKFIRPAVGATTNTGTVNAEGDVAHGSNLARLYGASGYGIKVAVLSDSLDDGHSALAHSRATGNIGPVTILPGQAGSGEAEGLAMLEIVHDLAPSATFTLPLALAGRQFRAEHS